MPPLAGGVCGSGATVTASELKGLHDGEGYRASLVSTPKYQEDSCTRAVPVHPAHGAGAAELSLALASGQWLLPACRGSSH